MDQSSLDFMWTYYESIAKEHNLSKENINSMRRIYYTGSHAILSILVKIINDGGISSKDRDTILNLITECFEDCFF